MRWTLTIDYTLQSNINLEHLTLTDDYVEHGLADNLNGQGNDVANRLQGNAGDNTLYGLLGNDSLDGGGGNDSLYGGEGNDSLYGGNDSAYVSLETVLVQEDDYSYETVNATLLSLSTNDDLLDGGDGDDTLDGGTGNDTLLGGEGNDQLYGGDDVDSYEYYLGEEQLHLTLDNPLSNNDYLDGGAGDDTLDGGSGDDTLIGGAGDDYLVGGEGNDILNGWDGEFYDYLEGGTGDDTYYIDGEYDAEVNNIEAVFIDQGGSCDLGSGDIDYTAYLKTEYLISDNVWENDDEGYDVVYSRVSVSLPWIGNIEAVYLVGDDDADIVGNDYDNLLQGNNGNNILDGGWGADTLIGGLGDDVYIIDDSADVIEEAELAGRDTVFSFVEDYQLGDNLENLYLGTGTLNGSGNDLDNLILGNSDNNIIDAQAGNDRIRAAEGDDTVYGGLGDDTYVYYTGDGNDVIFDAGGQDTLHFSEDIALSSLVFSLDDNDLVVSFSDAEGSIRLQDWLNTDNRIETLQFCGSTEQFDLTRMVLNETANQAPIALNDTGFINEDNQAGIIGNVLTNDTDPNGDSLQVANAGYYVLTYGVLDVAADGSYQYVLHNQGADVQHLGLGEQREESFSLIISDNGNPSLNTASILSFTINGQNDAPIVTVDVATVTEDAVSVQGNTLANDTDPDTGDVLSATATTLQGQYGTLVLDGTGHYDYQVNTSATQSLGLGDSVVDSFNTQVTDGSINVASSLAITVTGVNDVAVTQADSGSITVGEAALTGNVLANDSDVDAGTVLQTLATTLQGQYGTLTLGTDGSYQYQVNANQADIIALGAGASVVDNFSYTATDGITPVSDTLSITVIGRNDAPIVTTDVATVTEDTLSIQGNVLSNDIDPDSGDVLSATATTLQGQYGTLVLDSTGHYDYQVNTSATQSLGLGETAVDNFNTLVSDGSISVASSLAITVTGLNDVAVTQADSDSITVGEAALTGNVLANDSDVDAGTVLQTVASTIQGQYGTLTLGTDGSYQYQVNANQADIIALGAGASVVDNFSYTATDGITPVSDTLSITVTGRNDAPIVTADVATVSEDSSSVQGNILANDTDPDTGDVLSTTAITLQGQYGTLVLDGAGHYDYQVNSAATQFLGLGETAVENFNTLISDGSISVASSLAITVTGLNDVAVTQADSGSITVGEAALTGNVLANDSDVDAGTVLQTLATTIQGQYGILTLGTDGGYQYQVNAEQAEVMALGAGASVVEHFNYTATDGITPVSDTLSITVIGRNDAPLVIADTTSISEDSSVVTGNVLSNDRDVDIGDTLSAIAQQQQGQYGSLTITANGDYQYQLNNAAVQHLGVGQQVVEQLNYQATDGDMTVNSSIAVTITGENDAPVTLADTASITVGSANVSGNVLANDSDVDAGTVLQTLATTIQGQYGVLSLGTDGSYQYQVNANQADVIALGAGASVVDSFSYTATDGITPVSDTLSITVIGRNDAPIVTADVATVTEDTLSVQGNVLSNDTDPDTGDVLSTTATTLQGQYGTLVLDGTGHYDYQVNTSATQSLGLGETAVDNFNTLVTDGSISVASSLAITVTGLNDAPTTIGSITSQYASVGQAWHQTLPTLSTLFNDVDANDQLSFSLKQQSGLALPTWLHFNAQTGELSGTPTDQSSRLSLAVLATDKGGLSTQADFNLYINGLNVLGGLQNDTLIGSALNDTLNGGAGSDTLRGGNGDDIYYVDTLASQSCDDDDDEDYDEHDSGKEHGNEGLGNGYDAPPPGHSENQNDGFGSSIGHPLSSKKKKNDKDNDDKHDDSDSCSSSCITITGDQVIELANQGYDTVRSTVDYTLPEHVEALTLLGQANLNGTGNSLNNTLIGNSGANILNGLTGQDILIGLAGNDTYFVDNIGDMTIEAFNEGIDTVQSSITWTLADNLENLTLIGNSAINGTGNALDNILTGNSAKNTLAGGLGNDTYVVSTGDVVTELANAGVDTVISDVTWTLASNLENLTLIGSSAINGTGNALDNTLTGNSAKNTLAGGLGNDTYVVSTGDVVTELANAGIDTVISDVTWTLASNLENLTLIGSSAINGTGNALDNILTGNSAKNTLTGGLGNDTYVMEQGWGTDTLVDYDKTANNRDVVLFGEGISKEELWFSKKGNNLEVSLIGTTDKLVVSNWYKGDAYHTEQFKTAGGDVLDHNKVAQLVQAMSTMTSPSSSSGHGNNTLSQSQSQRLDMAIASSWS